MSTVHHKPTKTKARQKSKKATPLIEPGASAPDSVPGSSFSVGERVSHPMFGDGTVESIRDNVLTIAFRAGETREIREDFVQPKKS